MLLQFWPPQLPPINVTVQPPAGGMSEWEKTLISAGVGALFGILSSIAMEYVKPAIAKRSLKKTIEGHLGAEMSLNLGLVEALSELLKNEAFETELEIKLGATHCKMIGESITSDRFDFYFAHEKALVYEIDSKTTLRAFYQAVRTLKETIIGNHPREDVAGFLELAELTLIFYTMLAEVVHFQQVAILGSQSERSRRPTNPSL